jgi:flagellar hook-associated protein 2
MHLAPRRTHDKDTRGKPRAGSSMGSIISSGVGSGLDIAGLVTKLVEAEGAPLSARLNAQEAKAQGKLSALGSLRSALASFRDALKTLKDLDNFRGRKVERSSEEFLAATASTSAAAGSYRIEVQSLASAHRLASQTYGTASEVIGTGTLTIARGASAFSIDVTTGNESLAAIADAINEAADNVGVSATVVTGVDGARLVLSSTETGASNNIVVTSSGGDGGLADLVYDPSGSGIANLTQLQTAADAAVLIDDFAVTSSTNSVSGAIEGLDIDLLAGNEPGETTTVTVGYDRDGARGTIDKFVQAYNALLDALKNVSSYDVEKKQGSPLFGDAGVRNIGFQLRRELGAAVGSLAESMDTLSEIGVSAQLDGKLAVDKTKLDAAFAADFDAVGELFSTEETGIAVRLDAALEPYLKANGILDGRNETLKATIADIGERREQLDLRLQSLQQRLLRQFNALDGLLGQLQGTSNFLSQQLDRLPGAALFER